MFRHCLNNKSLFSSQNSRKTAMLPKKISFSSFFCFFSYAQRRTSPIPLPFFCPLIPPKGECGLRHCVSLRQPFDSLWFKGKIVSVEKLTPLCPRCSSRGGGGVPPLAVFHRAEVGVCTMGHKETRVSENAKGSPVCYSPIELVGKTRKRERRRSAGAMRARIMRGRARVRVERAKKGERRARRG